MLWDIPPVLALYGLADGHDSRSSYIQSFHAINLVGEVETIKCFVCISFDEINHSLQRRASVDEAKWYYTEELPAA